MWKLVYFNSDVFRNAVKLENNKTNTLKGTNFPKQITTKVDLRSIIHILNP